MPDRLRLVPLLADIVLKVVWNSAWFSDTNKRKHWQQGFVSNLDHVSIQSTAASSLPVKRSISRTDRFFRYRELLWPSQTWSRCNRCVHFLIEDRK